MEEDEKEEVGGGQLGGRQIKTFREIGIELENKIQPGGERLNLFMLTGAHEINYLIINNQQRRISLSYLTGTS